MMHTCFTTTTAATHTGSGTLRFDYLNSEQLIAINVSDWSVRGFTKCGHQLHQGAPPVRHTLSLATGKQGIIISTTRSLHTLTLLWASLTFTPVGVSNSNRAIMDQSYSSRSRSVMELKVRLGTAWSLKPFLMTLFIGVTTLKKRGWIAIFACSNLNFNLMGHWLIKNDPMSYKCPVSL